ncbi:hypothetical protein [Polyangium fumosum]|uniref:Uncharacterized protein n=1 Tax=Polyangium fumosum TaxID=889272 RepID=A0A4U1IS25_9BACT|nr:hypothetical protein [Polyangium fumosum]TKC97113.1 hypothetical protein E8A74_44745 [Polyangium fumosum]
MTKRLIRFAKRLAAWEADHPIEELQRIEFRNRDGSPDLRPSVYELDVSHPALVQAYAEHAAAAEIDPPTTALAIDASNPARTSVPTPGSAKFSFIMEAHREVLLKDVDDLHAFILELSQDPSERRSTIRKAEILAYARARLEAGDPEWDAVSTSPKLKKWKLK